VEGPERRKAANEAVFRHVNEQIESLQAKFAVSEQAPLYLVCECDRLDCTEPIHIGFEAYERVRSDPTQFIVLPGHEDPKVEDIVDTGAGCLIVRKHPGDPAAVARETDPRT
jgi:hypothetical protein